MHLGIDIDNTVADTTESVVRWYNLVLRKNIHPSDVRTYFLLQEYGLQREEAKKLWRRLELPVYRSCQPKPLAAETLTALAGAGHRVTFVTARPDQPAIARTTRRWLLEHQFPYTGGNLFLGAVNKVKIARELGIDLFFDDDPRHFASFLRGRIPAVLVHAPYNESVTAPFRLRAWSDAPAIVDGFAPRMSVQLSLFDDREQKESLL